MKQTENKRITRILKYRKCLLDFKNMGFEKVFSHNLGQEAYVSAEQVRKDFSFYGIKGNKKGGYAIDTLLNSINVLLRKDMEQPVIIVGIGNIGRALIQYKGFAKNKINIVAGFDIDPSKQNKKFVVPVYPNDMIPEIIKMNKVKIAILSVPEIPAQKACNQLIEAGIEGVLNFTPSILKTPPHVAVKNINLVNELEGLIYISNL